MTIVAYVIQTLENKSREKEIANLRINGICKKTFFRLYYYENYIHISVAILSCLVLYIGMNIIFSQSISLFTILTIIGEVIIYIILTKVIPFYISARQTFHKDISQMLRNNI